ncbi:hypothetical protein FGG08_004720 [Glutinoglossum americanum]|uniref:Uncharacterized protein n=1 Tax=Glutinoglossum americanum TaxID=1670608 RepID=A0A9P8I6X6_9PEZI|nr:hypothetical protein FGG08_004720 [Glutinoglossum americanum]
MAKGLTLLTVQLPVTPTVTSDQSYEGQLTTGADRGRETSDFATKKAKQLQPSNHPTPPSHDIYCPNSPFGYSEDRQGSVITIRLTTK